MSKKKIMFSQLSNLKRVVSEAEENHYRELKERRAFNARKSRRRLKSAIRIQKVWRGAIARTTVNEILNFKLAELLQERLDIQRSDGNWLEGYVYFVHSVTGEARWEKPKRERIEETSKWIVQMTDEDDETNTPAELYYWNPTSGESKWYIASYDEAKSGIGSKKWRHGDDDSEEEDYVGTSEEEEEKEEHSGAPILSVIGDVGTSALRRLRDHLSNRFVSVKDREEDDEEDAEDTGEDDEGEKQVPDMKVLTPFGEGLCVSRRDGIWKIKLDDDRMAYCDSGNVIVGYGTSRSFHSEKDKQEERDDVMLTRARLEAERQSELRLQHNIQSRIPLPFLNNDDDDESSDNTSCVRRSDFGLPAVFRKFVRGLNEGLKSDGE